MYLYQLNWRRHWQYQLTDHYFCDGDYCCDQAGDDHVRPDWKGDGWYRITGEAGTKIFDSPVEKHHCGTAASGWLSGGHPSPEEGLVTRTVCFVATDNDCLWEAHVDVLNCNDAYFVYYLVDTPTCNLGYCTE